MRATKAKLQKRYESIEKNFLILDNSPRYEELVRANGNHSYPVQRWFHLKEAFSLNLLETLLTDWKIPPTSLKKILDPFCGIGTTLLAAQKIAKTFSLDELELIGIERNPFIHFVAKTKLNWYKYDTEKLKQMVHFLSRDSLALESSMEIPELSTLKRKGVYTPAVLNKLLNYRKKILTLTLPERELILLGFAAILEAVSGVRKDGRALRIVSAKKRSRVGKALPSSWQAILDDLDNGQIHYKPINAKIYLGDGRKIMPDRASKKISGVDLILFSPPYINNIDYTEVYKLELWLCGFINKASEFRNLRYKTFRSHPSVRFPTSTSLASDPKLKKAKRLIDLLIGTLPKDKNLSQRTALIQSYFDDIYIALKNQKKALSPGGWSFCVIGNSLHGSSAKGRQRTLIAADLITALIANSLGLRVEGIQVARKLNRRFKNKYLRESIIVMKSPGNLQS